VRFPVQPPAEDRGWHVDLNTPAGRLVDEVSHERPVAGATGQPGDMYLLHPFTVHAADEHRGSTPRFMAQSPILLAKPLSPQGPAALACAWEA